MFKLDLEKAEEPEIKLPTSVRSSKKQESSRKTSTSALFTMPKLLTVFSSVQSLSRVRLFATPWIAARQASLSITNSRSSLRLTSIESVMPSSHLILCRPLFLLPPIPPSIRVFSNESTLRMRWPKYWSFSFSIISSKEHPGLISFRMDWLDLLAVQGTLKSLLQHHSSKASRHLLRVGTGNTKVKKKQSSALGTTLGSQLELLGERDSQDPSNYFSGPWAKVAESRGRWGIDKY